MFQAAGGRTGVVEVRAVVWCQRGRQSAGRRSTAAASRPGIRCHTMNDVSAAVTTPQHRRTAVRFAVHSQYTVTWELSWRNSVTVQIPRTSCVSQHSKKVKVAHTRLQSVGSRS